MYKLIELLNEYRKEKYPKSKLRYYKYDSLNHEFLSNCIPNDSEEKVLGRRFGFIDWLLKEDKIDLGKIAKLYRKSNENSTATYPILYDYTYDESLLMFLAIQDNQTEFLISILK